MASAHLTSLVTKLGQLNPSPADISVIAAKLSLAEKDSNIAQLMLWDNAATINTQLDNIRSYVSIIAQNAPAGE